MKARKELLAYCGFYCGDCLGCTGVIAEAATTFAGSCVKNLKAIRDMGLEAWLAAGPRHCYWLEEAGCNPG